MSLERRAQVRTRLGWVTTLSLLSLFVMLGVGCRDTSEPPEQRRYPNDSAANQAKPRTVQVRNSCPEQVELAISASAPDPSTPTTKLNSTKVVELTVAQGERIWLRRGVGFEVDLSVIPTGPVEIGFQCDAIYASHGGR